MAGPGCHLLDAVLIPVPGASASSPHPVASASSPHPGSSTSSPCPADSASSPHPAALTLHGGNCTCYVSSRYTPGHFCTPRPAGVTGPGVGEAAGEAGHGAGQAVGEAVHGAGEAGHGAGEAAFSTACPSSLAELSAKAPHWARRDDTGIGFASGIYSQVHYGMLLQTLPCWMKSY